MTKAIKTIHRPIADRLAPGRASEDLRKVYGGWRYPSARAIRGARPGNDVAVGRIRHDSDGIPIRLFLALLWTFGLALIAVLAALVVMNGRIYLGFDHLAAAESRIEQLSAVNASLSERNATLQDELTDARREASEIDALLASVIQDVEAAYANEQMFDAFMNLHVLPRLEVAARSEDVETAMREAFVSLGSEFIENAREAARESVGEEAP